MTRPMSLGIRWNARVRCPIYTRKSSEEGLDQEFNSLQAQREAWKASITSQRHEGWVCLRAGYDDGGFSGVAMGRPALQRLLADITGGRVDIVVVYKIDRLTRSLADFAKIVEILDTRSASYHSAMPEGAGDQLGGRNIGRVCCRGRCRL
jgi:site-specific DNA recombinase